MPPSDELNRDWHIRAGAFPDAAATTAGVIVAGCTRTEAPPPAPAQTSRPGSSGSPRIAIVGAGMAGLNAAYKLKQSGLTATIFEGANRTGGRMFTARDLLGDGLTTELGGEFIDSNHMGGELMPEFGLERLDTRGPSAGALKFATYFQRPALHARRPARAFVPMPRAFRRTTTRRRRGELPNEGGGSALDRQSIANIRSHRQ